MNKDELYEYARSLEAEAEQAAPALGEAENVNEAILNVMFAVGYVQKEESSQLRYSFASERAFIAALRPAMLANGLYIHPVEMKELATEGFTSKSGSTINSRRVVVTYAIVHAPSQSSIRVQVVGEGMDTGDKATNKAMTIAYKYALRQTFLIETGDDPDEDPSEDYLRDAEEREAAVRGTGRSHRTGQTAGQRQKNQWEAHIVDLLVDELGLVDSKPHAIAILNNSIFFGTVPYGQLSRTEAVTYVLAYESSKEKAPDMESQERARQLNQLWGSKSDTLDKYAEAADELLGNK
jgi:hypothetical protein